VKTKHLKYWLECTLALAELSECSRRKFGAIIVDPVSNVSLVNGYNGAARGGSKQCAGDNACSRDIHQCESGTRLEIGCNHAEANALANAARIGISTLDKWLVVNGEPCIACAKLIHQAGISKVVCLQGVYTVHNGIEYLKQHLEVHQVSLAEDDLKEVLTAERKLPLFAYPTAQPSPFSITPGRVGTDK